MPSAEIKNPKKNPNIKGKPLGIPTWGWVAAIALGLVIGYLMIRNKNASASDASSSGADSSPLGTSTGQSGGGGVATPSPDQKAQFLQSTGFDNGQPVSSPSGDTSLQFSNLSTTTPFSSELPISNLSANAPVYSRPSAPGSDFLTGGVANHPGTVGTTGGYVVPNYSVLNTPIGSSARRPGIQL